jgi:putative transposase
VPICRALGIQGVAIAPRTYWAYRSSAPSKRALWDTAVTEILDGYWTNPMPTGNARRNACTANLKMWAHLQRQGIAVARRTVERIMRHHGWRGVTRARRAPRTTERDPVAAPAPDLVGRKWRVAAPNLLDVADFKCRRRHLKSYADPRNMLMVLAMVQASGSVEVQKVGIVAWSWSRFRHGIVWR